VRNFKAFYEKGDDRDWQEVTGEESMKRRDEKLFSRKRDNLAKQAKCFRCKKKFSPKANQHPKYSLCPKCKSYREEFGSGLSWIDHGFSDPKRGW
jgi:hypothetical protein